ncbi:TPA: hypothetical protein ACH3X2_009206 [Trebouxia sp. C0005]
MKSGEPILVFGTGYGSVTLDSNSVTTGQATNPASTGNITFYVMMNNCDTPPCAEPQLLSKQSADKQGEILPVRKGAPSVVKFFADKNPTVEDEFFMSKGP